MTDFDVEFEVAFGPVVAPIRETIKQAAAANPLLAAALGIVLDKVTELAKHAVKTEMELEELKSVNRDRARRLRFMAEQLDG